MNVENKQRTDHYLAGGNGPKLLEGKVNTTSFRGTKLRNPPSNITEFDTNEGMQPLTINVRTIGNFFTMSNTYLDNKNYCSAHRKIRIYDESDRDDWATIDLMDAIKHSGRFEPTGGNLVVTHQALANDWNQAGLLNGEDPEQRDMFITVDANGTYKPVVKFGEMHADYLPQRILHAIALSATKDLSEADRLALANAPTVNVLPADATAAQIAANDEANANIPAFKHLRDLLRLRFNEDAGTPDGEFNAVFDDFAKRKHHYNPQLKDQLFKLRTGLDGIEGQYATNKRAEYQSYLDALAVAPAHLERQLNVDIQRVLGGEGVTMTPGVPFTRLDEIFEDELATGEPPTKKFKSFQGKNVAPAEYDIKLKEKQAGNSGPWYLVAARYMFLQAKVNLYVLEAMYRHDVHVPVDFRIMRPFMRYAMQSSILLRGGYDTGQTNFGHMDVTVSSDGANKSSLVNATWWISSMVTNPGRVVHMPHIAYAGILGGAGSRFFTEAQLLDLANVQWVINDTGSPSLIAVMVPFGTETRYEDLDIRGKDMDFDGGRQCYYPTYPFELKNRHFDSLTNPFTVPDLWKGSRGDINTICWQGTQYACGPEAGKYTERTINKGHHGEYEYPGCQKIRRGKGQFINPMQMPIAL